MFEYVRQITTILRINTVNSFQRDTAYFGNNLGNLVATLSYNAIVLLTIQFIFSRTPAIAGYSKAEFLCLIFVSQITYYILTSLVRDNMDRLESAIYGGQLDVILTKPLPHRFYLSWQSVPIVSMLRDAIPPMILVACFIDWPALHLRPLNIAIATVILALGVRITRQFSFLLVAPAFWVGRSRAFNAIFIGLISKMDLPYEGSPAWLKWSFFTIGPVFVATAVAASALMNKTNPWWLLTITLAAAAVYWVIEVIVWRLAMRHYVSASS